MVTWSYPMSTQSNFNPVVVLEATGDGVYVGSAVSIVTYAVSSTIGGAFSNHQAWIDGSVAGTYAIGLGDDYATDSGERVHVSVNGRIFSGSLGITLSAFDSSVVNAGQINSDDTAIAFGGFDLTSVTGTTSSIGNSGSIYGAVYAIKVFDDSAEDINIKNTGTITGGVASFNSFGDGAVHIVNTGSMIGQIILGSSDDVYDGRKGNVAGTIFGQDGGDTIMGGKEKNVFAGEAGKDILIGGKGGDRLTGGTDADLFVFKTISDSTVKVSGQDTIFDFKRSEGDLIDLRAIDANASAKGNQAFHFIGNHAFSGDEGELHAVKSGSGQYIVSGDINGDGKEDFAIHVYSTTALKDIDFHL